MRPFYHLATATMKTLLTALTRWEVHGKRNVPRKGPLIVVSNHLTIVDPPLLGASIPRVVNFMAKEELYRTWFSRTVVEAYRAFPVHRGRLDRGAFREALNRLQNNLVVGMFPEGQRSSDQKLQSPQFGAALLALRAGAPLLPVGISGTERIKGLRFILHRPRVEVNIGPVFSLEPPDKRKLTREKLVQDSERIMGKIALQLPEQYRGHYGSGRVEGGDGS
ncbi:MAG: 1-acyl-sn-glycerol-3-phosphate acyltransferase [Dehalococcoidia bacterium]|nr:1-acyl-sn-glycerol-3-phosphate acyltransferase [Dehalococcoidia bacterium]